MSFLLLSRLLGVGFELSAFFAGLYTYRYHNATFRVLFFLLFFIVIHESEGLYVSMLSTVALQKEMIGIFNVYIFYETIFIYLIGLKASDNRFYRGIITVTTAVFFIYSLLNIYFNGMKAYPTVPLLLYAANGLVIFLGLLIQSSDSADFYTKPVFILSIGMIVFYGCTMPYISVVNYFAKVDNESLKWLAQILFISNYIRYGLSAVAFIALYRQQKAKKLAPSSQPEY